MKVWTLRCFKIAPFITGTAWVGYTSAVLADPELVAAHLNAVILSGLVMLNVAAVGFLLWALLVTTEQELRRPRLRFLAVAEPRNPFAGWNGPTQTGEVYRSHARPAVASSPPPRHPLDQLEQEYDDPTDNIRRAS